MTNLDAYIGRLLSSCFLYLLLSTANIWLTPLQNTVMAFGYRLFILLVPFIFNFFKHKITFASFILVELGLVLWLFNIVWVGVVVFIIGIAINSYMFKYYASSTVHGVSWNKIAINIGSVLSGVIVIFTQKNNVVLMFSIFGMLVAWLSFISYYKRNDLKNYKSHPKHFSFTGFFSFSGLSWGVIGFTIGVKVIAIYSLLPQFLIQKYNALPWWYGIMVILNSLLVIFFQIPVMRYVSKLSDRQALYPLYIGMFCILITYYFPIYTFSWAFIWTFVLTLIECAISYLDKLSQDDHALLVKESFTGIGSAFMVYFARAFNAETSALLVGSISIALLIISSLLISNKSNKVTA